MADRYLLESSSVDGYLLEDSSGVLLLELTAGGPVGSQVTASAPTYKSAQGGYSTVPNLLVTTLALFAVASQDVKRDADLHSYKPAPAVQVFQPPNLLTSTLGVQVVAPVGEQVTQSAPSVNNLNEWQQYHNPLLFTLPLPQGQQQTDSAPPPINIGAAQQNQARLVLEQVVQPIPIGRQQTDSAPSSKQVLYWDKGTNTLLLTLPLPIGEQQTGNSVGVSAVQVFTPEQIVPPAAQAVLPPGQQHTESSPSTSRIGDIRFARGVDAGPPITPAELPIGDQRTESAQPPPSQVDSFRPPTIIPPASAQSPIGRSQIDSAPIPAPDVSAEQTQSRVLLEQTQQPLPIGVQSTENEVQTPSVQVFTPEQIIPPTVVQAELPPGHQSTDSSPPTSRIGEMIYARGVDAVPTPDVPIPIGHQSTDSAPYTIFRPLIDEPQNLLAGPLGLQPIASSQSELLPTVRPSQVFLWLPPNVTINLPVPVIEIPIGDQRTETQVTTPAVTVFTPPQIIPPVLQPLPVGQQHTDSAPIPAPGVQSYTAPVIIPPISGPLPIGKQVTESAPVGRIRPQIDQPANLIAGPLGLPPVASEQSNYLGPIWTPPIEFWQAPIIMPPPPEAIPAGRQKTDSAPIWAVSIGTSVGWTIPPDLLPPFVPPPEPPRVEILGGDPVKKRKKSPREEIRDLLNEPSREKVVLVSPTLELPKVLQPVAKVVPVEYLPPIGVLPVEGPPPPIFSDEDMEDILSLIHLGIL